MRPIWKGSVSFGLVNIPVALFPATRREELTFRMLRARDLSPINYKRVAEADGREVPWGEIVKGYEYEKGKFIVLKDEDFRRVDVEATETIDIIDFVNLREVSPIFFAKPYYLEAQKGATKAYALLRDALRESGKAGITKVVIKTRQHLAALKPQDRFLVLELMHFADELVDPERLKMAAETKAAGKRELAMARALIDEMSAKWDPNRYTDDYRSALTRLIENKIKHGGKALPSASKPRRTTGDVIDLVAVLKQSLAETGKTKPAKTRARAKSATARKSARKAAA